MPGMMQSPRNRIQYDVDNPINSDGFYDYYVPVNRRRTIRHKEKQQWKKEVENGEV